MRPITSTLSDSRLGSRRAIAIEERPFHPLQRLIGRRPDAAVSRTRCTTPREAEVIGSERPRAPTIPTASCHDRCEDGHGRFFMLSQFRPSTVASDARTRRGRRRRATPSAADQGDAVRQLLQDDVHAGRRVSGMEGSQVLQLRGCGCVPSPRPPRGRATRRHGWASPLSRR